MIKPALQSILFVFAILFAVEFSLRIVYFGADALSPEKMNSHVLILDSEFVRAADHPDIYYELKPELNSIYRGKRFSTNSQGMPDREYALEKPADTYRVAVTGSSWSMATGIPTGGAYEAILEDMLTNGPDGKSVEILNYSVEYYGLAEMTGTIRHKVLPHEPDLIIFPITTVTPSFLWETHTEPFERKKTVPPFLRSYLLSALMEAIGRPLYANTQRPRVMDKRGDFMRQIKRAMRSLNEMTANKNVKVLVIWLSYDQLNESMIKHSRQHALDQGFVFLPINLKEKARLYGYEGNLLTGKVDRHPNETAHKVIAETIYREYFSAQSQ